MDFGGLRSNSVSPVQPPEQLWCGSRCSDMVFFGSSRCGSFGGMMSNLVPPVWTLVMLFPPQVAADQARTETSASTTVPAATNGYVSRCAAMDGNERSAWPMRP